MSQRYSEAFRAEAFSRLTAGWAVGETARSLEMPQPTLWKWYYRWVREGALPARSTPPGDSPGSRQPPPTDPVLLARRVRELERRLAIMEEEQQILGKVSALLATQRTTSTKSVR